MSFPAVDPHNPGCATSRNVPGRLRAGARGPMVIDHLPDRRPPGPSAGADGQVIIDEKGRRLV